MDYLYDFLNFYLIWNTGIGFGLIAMDASIYYHILTFIIIIVNIGLIYFLLLRSLKKIVLLNVLIK